MAVAVAVAVAVGTGDDAGAEAGVVSRSSGVRSGVDTRRDPSEACADRSGADELRGMLGCCCCCCACPGAPYGSMSGCTFQAKPPGVDASCEATSEAHAAVASYSALDDSAAPPVTVPQATAEGPMSVAMSLSAPCPCSPANAAADDGGGAVTAAAVIAAADASALPSGKAVTVWAVAIWQCPLAG